LYRLIGGSPTAELSANKVYFATIRCV